MARSQYETITESDLPASLAWASTGPEGSGKSWYAMTAPGPIFYAAFDEYGWRRVDPERRRSKEIILARYPFKPTRKKGAEEVSNLKEAIDTWSRFQEDWLYQIDRVRTIVLDREDLAWKLFRFATFGKKSDAASKYETVNEDYIALLQMATRRSVNLGLLRGVGDKWVSKFDPAKGKMVGHNTGEIVPEGMKLVPDLVDVVLWHRWDDKERAFFTKLQKFPNVEERGREHQNLDFPMMAMLAFPQVDPAVWGL